MGSLIHPKLGLDCRFSPQPLVQRPIGRFLGEVSRIRCESDKIMKLDDYVNRLKEEMKKIDAFKRELPFCMLLVSEAIAVVQEELARCKNKTDSEPVLEEFMPLKKICADEKNDKVEDTKEFIPLKKICADEKDDKVVDTKEKDVTSRDKKNWMSSVQLWNSNVQPSDSNTGYSSKKSSTNADSNNKKRMMGEEINQVMDDAFASAKNRAFASFKESPNFSVVAVGKEEMDELPVPGLSLCTPGTKNSKEVINPIGSGYSRSGSSPPNSNLQPSFKTAAQLQTSRKQRRCWSPELHRMFINALQHLGGPQAATPKQIREQMQVDGLTNDEVKSHLQKYRLHMRRVALNSTSQNAASWTSEEPFVEFKLSNGQSGSPEGPLHISRCEDEDDE